MWGILIKKNNHFKILAITTSGTVGVSILSTFTGSSGGTVMFLLTNI